MREEGQFLIKSLLDNLETPCPIKLSGLMEVEYAVGSRESDCIFAICIHHLWVAGRVCRQGRAVLDIRCLVTCNFVKTLLLRQGR